MSSISLARKTGSKPSSKPVEKTKPLPPPEPTSDPSPDDDENGWDEDSGGTSGSDEEDDDVDEAGFQKLIEALGDDGLNEYDQANLVALVGDDEGDKENKEDEDAEEEEEVSGSEEEEEVLEEGEGGSGSGSEGAVAEEGESSGDEDVLALDELEDVELHPDAIPRRGVKVIDKKVRHRGHSFLSI